VIKLNTTTIGPVMRAAFLRRSNFMIPVHLLAWIIALVGLIGGLLLYLFLGVLLFTVWPHSTGSFADLRLAFLPQEAVVIPWLAATGFYCLTALLLVLFSLTGTDKLRMRHMRSQQSLLLTNRCADGFQRLAASMMRHFPRMQSVELREK